MGKMGEFWPNSKAIGLVFWRILTKNKFHRFSSRSEKWVKWGNFGQKVRL